MAVYDKNLYHWQVYSGVPHVNRVKTGKMWLYAPVGWYAVCLTICKDAILNSPAHQHLKSFNQNKFKEITILGYDRSGNT